MADLTQTAANVKVKSNSNVTIVTVGEAVSAGMPGYKNTADSNKYYKAITTNATTALAAGIFMTSAATAGSAVFLTSGDCDLGATLVIGETYFVSNTTGKIMPSADVSTGEFVTSLGTATAADNFPLSIQASGIARA